PGTFQLVLEKVRLVPVQVSFRTAGSQEGSDSVGIEKRGLDIDLGASRKNRVTVLGHEPGDRARHAVGLQTRHDFAQASGNLHQLRRRIGANVVERVKFKRKKIERDVRPAHIFKKSIHPGTIARGVRPGEQLVFEVLQTRAAELKARVETDDAAGSFRIKR